VDILVNNAAFARGPDRTPAAELDEAIFRRVLEVKVVGSFLMCKSVIPILIDQGEGGRIVNISSIAGKLGTPNASAYVAANAALQGFSQSLAKELGRHGISVNAVCPGITDTSRMDDLGRGELWQKTIKERVPLQRAASDQEIAGLIAFLCTPRGEYINGQLINMDGGIATW
jgi:3-oxoacyl-[acyl-carrier protein] reductase/meso-butanediol dehydrogenase/(S,S)-butanediol dehydrogenase/diacetyl reductase